MHYNTCITELPLNKAEHACININTVIQCECAVIIIFFKTFTLQSYHSNFGRRASIILHPGSLQQTEPILAVLHPMTYVYTWKIGLVWSFMETAKNHHDFGQKKWALLLD